MAWRLIKRYNEETESDVITPEDIVDGLVHDNGVSNSVVDFIKVSRKNVTLRGYAIAQQCEIMAPLGTPADI